jgi:hypothetical protein
MEPIPDLAALKPIVDALLERGLMVEVTPAGRGQVVSHKLYPSQELAELRSRYTADGRDSAPSHPPATLPHQSGPAPARDEPTPGAPAPGLAELAEEIAELRAEVTRLREAVRDLESGRDVPRG